MRRSLLLVLLAACALALAAGASGTRDTSAPPRAHNGVIDLRGHDLERQAIVNLDGEWEFYWRRFVAPQAFAAASAPPTDGLLTLPGSWHKRRIGDQVLGTTGYATLRLRILAPVSKAPLALRLVGFFPANRIWINGRLAAASGRIAERAEDEVMNRALQIVELPNDGQLIELIIHVSNFKEIVSATTHVEFGRATDVNSLQIGRWSLAMLSVGTLLLMGCYHLALFAFRRTDAGPLYLGLNCLFWVGNILCIETSEWAIRIFLPEAPGEILFRIWPFCLFMASALAYQFYRSLFPREFARWIGRLIWMISLGYILIALAAPLPVLASALPAYYLITVLRMIYSAWALLQATRHQRPGAPIILCGYLLMLMLAINDMLNGMGVIHTVLVLHLGMIVYMFSQSLALALRFAALHASVEKLSSVLETRNRALAEEIAERTRLQQEIVSVSEQERRRISHQLHDGLCQLLTGARLQCAGLSTLWSRAATDADDELRRLSALLDEAVDHARDLAHGLWPIDPESDDAMATLTALVQHLRETSGITIELHAVNRCAHCYAPHAAQIYGIAREAIVNAIKHAAPTRIDVTLDCSAGPVTTLTVVDDGWAPPVKATSGGLGKRIMAYRAHMVGGSFAVDTAPPGGTCVRCTLPCAALADAGD